jgi:hypothetical protein
MAVVFPWLDYSYVGEKVEVHANEFAEHRLHVRLNDIAKAQLLLSGFYEKGATEGNEETIYDWGEIDDDFDDYFRRAMSKDD